MVSSCLEKNANVFKTAKVVKQSPGSVVILGSHSVNRYWQYFCACGTWNISSRYGFGCLEFISRKIPIVTAQKAETKAEKGKCAILKDDTLLHHGISRAQLVASKSFRSVCCFQQDKGRFPKKGTGKLVGKDVLLNITVYDVWKFKFLFQTSLYSINCAFQYRTHDIPLYISLHTRAPSCI